MEPATLITLLAFGLQGVGLIAGAIWVVGRISSETRVLNNSIDNLSATVGELKNVVAKVDDKQDALTERVIRLEEHPAIRQEAS